MSVKAILDSCAVYQIEDSEKHWFVAESEEDALQRYAEHYGFSGIQSARDQMGDIEVHKLADDEVITVMNYMEQQADVTRTAREWIQVLGAGGLLCSTVW